MQIYGPSQLHGAQPINAPHIQRTAEPAAPAATNHADRVDISPAAELAGQLAEIPDIRADRVAAIKTAIANGTYETSAKLDVAIERLLDEIA
jgi:negative regulator of flagellin synthesis FlgM